MICGEETHFKMNLGGIEASFCYEHLTENFIRKNDMLAKCLCYI